jgi:hypothetical protein
MATRGRTTFQKRQKEMARKERQQMKAERRAQRKLAGPEPESDAYDGQSSESSESEWEPNARNGGSTPPLLTS